MLTIIRTRITAHKGAVVENAEIIEVVCDEGTKTYWKDSEAVRGLRGIRSREKKWKVSTDNLKVFTTSLPLRMVPEEFDELKRQHSARGDVLHDDWNPTALSGHEILELQTDVMS